MSLCQLGVNDVLGLVLILRHFLPLLYIPEWEWQNENGQWIKYDIQITRDLENVHSQVGETSSSVRGGRRRKNQVAITAAGRSYTVDIAKMEQKNSETGVIRKVRRLASTGKGQFINSDIP